MTNEQIRSYWPMPNVAEDFLSYAYGLAAEAEFKNCSIVPDDIWEHATETFDWDEVAASVIDFETEPR